MNGVRFLLAFGISCAAFLPSLHAAVGQPHQGGPTIRELFEASQSFSGGAPQVIILEKQGACFAVTPGTAINFFGGDCLTLISGKLSICTSERTLELKADEFHFEVLNDSLANFELDQNGSLRASSLRGPGLVLSFSSAAKSTESEHISSNKIMQIKEGQSYKFNKRRDGASDFAKADRAIRYADPSLEIIEEAISPDWHKDPLILQLRKCSSSNKRMKLLIKPAR